jgi:hypothetical protein
MDAELAHYAILTNASSFMSQIQTAGFSMRSGHDHPLDLQVVTLDAETIHKTVFPVVAQIRAQNRMCRRFDRVRPRWAEIEAGQGSGYNIRYSGQVRVPLV